MTPTDTPAPDSSELRAIAAAIYKLGVVAAELGLTGQESAEELRAAVRALKARAAAQAPLPYDLR
jgi:2-methylaconitate cis-trans-isomerase PrpF